MLYSVMMSAIERRITRLRRRSDAHAMVSGNILCRITLLMKLTSRKALSVRADEATPPKNAMTLAARNECFFVQPSGRPLLHRDATGDAVALGPLRLRTEKKRRPVSGGAH